MTTTLNLDAEALYLALRQGVRGLLGAMPDAALVGIWSGGAWLAARLHADLGLPGEPGVIPSALHRDDFSERGLSAGAGATKLPFAVEGRRILLIDDVLYTGRTIRAEKQYDLVIDLREDRRAAGFCLWQYGMGNTGASDRIVGRIQAAGYPIEHETHMILLRPRNGMVDAPMWGLTFLRLFRQLTIAGYVRRNVSSSVFTVVTPAAPALNDRIAMQRIAVEELLAEYAAAP